MYQTYLKYFLGLLCPVLLFFTLSQFIHAEDAAKVLEKIDGYRQLDSDFYLDIKISDYESNNLKEDATFAGYFSGNDKSLLICSNGKNKGMKVLMKGDNMWVNLSGSKRGLRITPMQRLMGQASNGDVAKVSFSLDYTGVLLAPQGEMLVMELKARSKGATYQKVILYADAKTYKPQKAEFFLTSGKHFKTAYYQEFKVIDGQNTVSKMKIEDKMNPKLYTVMENSNYKKKPIPEKYFNVMYLANIEAE